MREKREAADEFTKNIGKYCMKEKTSKAFDKSVRNKLNELKDNKLYQHELKQDIDKFTQKKFKS